MKVCELIEALQKIDPSGEMDVVVDGYEGGYDDVREIKPIRIGELVSPCPDFGLYDDLDEQTITKEAHWVVYLPR